MEALPSTRPVTSFGRGTTWAQKSPPCSAAAEYEFWRTVRAAHLPALVAALNGQPGDDVARLFPEKFDSDVALKDFAEERGIPTEFSSWSSTNWDDDWLRPGMSLCLHHADMTDR